LQGEDTLHILFNRGKDLGELKWKQVQLPNAYINDNWPTKVRSQRFVFSVDFAVLTTRLDCLIEPRRKLCRGQRSARFDDLQCDQRQVALVWR